ncbi:hypothetical protein K7640_24160 [Micromonospora sp. PLK6-60]|uniref:hypothetical protein n=1 Tax=Micromonospora sp. PLK6-60 TaxID=2873383 RepID=UPI001CA759F5|nr:hypothetical protein [Micromonospora sp. PLK6-60]MBY8874927.1 hypothetical protein [Micromonospora sp. PLK6-60]
MEDREREQALLTALTTEHFVLQTSRSATITESVGRTTVFLSLLSAGLIGLGFVSGQGALIRPYLAAVLPTLVITGLLTFARLVQNMVENSLDLRRIQQIRAYYQERYGAGYEFFADAVGSGGPMRAAWAAVGSRPGRLSLLLTTAAMVAAVNALLIGVGVALLLALAGAGSTVAIVAGVVAALAAFVVQLTHVRRASISQLS